MKEFPYEDGDTIVLGPEIFATKDGSVICWKGENYVPHTINDPYETLNDLHRRVSDKRWEISAFVNRDSRWFRAVHPNGIKIDRAESRELIDIINKIEVEKR